MQRKAVFVTTRLFWPPDSGRKVSLYNYCRGLSERHGYEVYLYSFLEDGQDASLVNSAPHFVKQIELAKDVGLATKIVNLAKAIFNREMPLQCCLYMSAQNSSSLQRYIREVDPDVVLIDMVRLAPYLDTAVDYPTVMDFDDMLSKRYRRQVGRTGSNVLGRYGARTPSFIKSLLRLSVPRNVLLNNESHRIEKAEKKYGTVADSCLFVSSVEAEELNLILGKPKCFAAPLGVEARENARNTIDYEFEFGFVGNMYAAANQDSLEYIVKVLMPLLPRARLLVIGVCPEDVLARYADSSNVEFTGRVDSIKSELEKCGLLLAPFVYGTGIKTKVIESMGFGVPVVTNSLGAEGLNVVAGRDLIVSDEPQEMISLAKELLNDVCLRIEMGNAGRCYVRKFHNWETIFEELGACVRFAQNNHRNSSD